MSLSHELDARTKQAIRDIIRSTEADRYRFTVIAAAVVRSVPFQMRPTK